MIQGMDRTDSVTQAVLFPSMDRRSDPIFSDVSAMGMGVASYFVAQVGNQSKSQLVFSKSSLMPKNPRKGAEVNDSLTIARVELIGLLMGVNMGKYLLNAIKCHQNSQTVYFTDSLLNLQRGKGHSKVWEERRIVNILDNTHEAEIRFCPGKLNPADLLSRGYTLEELASRFHFWSRGPEFLVQARSEWPQQPVIAGHRAKDIEAKGKSDPRMEKLEPET
jgi:hypothetical protein